MYSARASFPASSLDDKNIIGIDASGQDLWCALSDYEQVLEVIDELLRIFGGRLDGEYHPRFDRSCLVGVKYGELMHPDAQSMTDSLAGDGHDFTFLSVLSQSIRIFGVVPRLCRSDGLRWNLAETSVHRPLLMMGRADHCRVCHVRLTALEDHIHIDTQNFVSFPTLGAGIRMVDRRIGPDR